MDNYLRTNNFQPEDLQRLNMIAQGMNKFYGDNRYPQLKVGTLGRVNQRDLQSYVQNLMRSNYQPSNINYLEQHRYLPQNFNANYPSYLNKIRGY